MCVMLSWAQSPRGAPSQLSGSRLTSKAVGKGWLLHNANCGGRRPAKGLQRPGAGPAQQRGQGLALQSVEVPWGFLRASHSSGEMLPPDGNREADELIHGMTRPLGGCQSALNFFFLKYFVLNQELFNQTLAELPW